MVSSGVQAPRSTGIGRRRRSWTSCSSPTARRGRPRGALVEELERLGPEGLIEAGRRRDAIFMQQGITFETERRRRAPRTNGRSRSTSCRACSAARNGRTIKRGLAQRIRALNHFVDDVYHAREIVREGIVPWRLVVSCPHFARAVHGIRPPGGVYTHVAGCDLVRHSDGTLEGDRGQRAHPRRASPTCSRTAPRWRAWCPSCSPSYRVRPVDHYPQLLLRALRAVAPVGRERGDGRRVDARTGQPARTSSTPSWPARWASSWSRPRTWWCATTSCYMRTTRGPRARARGLPAPRRRLRRPARVPPRLAARRPRPGARLPRRQRRDRQRVRHGRRRRQGDLLLRARDDPLLPRRGADPRERHDLPARRTPKLLEHVLGRLDELVVKPTGESGGKGVMIGPHADEAELAAACAR